MVWCRLLRTLQVGFPIKRSDYSILCDLMKRAPRTFSELNKFRFQYDCQMKWVVQYKKFQCLIYAFAILLIFSDN